MQQSEDTIPSPNDWVYRRVSLAKPFFKNGQISIQGLGPNSGDISGTSVTLDSLSKSPLDCLGGKPPEKYVIAAFQVKHIYDAGFTLVPDPRPPDNPGHFNIKGMDKANKSSKEVVQFLDKICRLENGLLKLIWPPGAVPPVE
jgi:hypothetical protein